jgi:hypothetical protein
VKPPKSERSVIEAARLRIDCFSGLEAVQGSTVFSLGEFDIRNLRRRRVGGIERSGEGAP